MKLNDLTILEAQKALFDKKFSALELVASCLERVKEVDRKINALITVCDKQALDQAKKADKLLTFSTTRKEDKPLLGIPFVLKDLFLTSGIRTTAGSKVLENYIPVYDATVSRKLKEAGAIIIGKANCDAWGHGSSGENSDFGSTRNPWNLAFVPGGSSSGSAAALAAGECLAATGTDTGGSIRLPASFCNLVGLKPTYGRVSRYGIIAMASSLDSPGHFAKTVKDSAFILGVTAGQDPLDATTPNIPVDDYLKTIEQEIKGVKIGLPKEYFAEGISSEMKEKVNEAVLIFEKLGAKIIEISLPHTQYALACYYLIQPSEVSSNLARYDGIRFGYERQKFEDEAKRRIMLGTFALSSGYYDAYYLKAMKVRTLIKQDFDRAFEKVDAILAPVSPTPPFKIGEKVDDPLKMYLSDIYTVTANLAGIPGLALPVGFIAGLPVGIQVLGPQFSEKLLFRIGYNFEQETKIGKGDYQICF